MAKRIIAYLIPVLILAGFAYLLRSGEYHKKPRGGGDDVLAHIQLLNNKIEEEKWDEADRTLTDLEEAWGKVVPRIQYSVDRDDIIRMDAQLARTRGAIMGKSKAAALTELSEVNYFWHALGK